LIESLMFLFTSNRAYGKQMFHDDGRDRGRVTVVVNNSLPGEISGAMGHRRILT